MWIKLLLLLSLVVFFSTFLSPLFNVFVSMVVYFLAHALPFLHYYYQNLAPHASRVLARIINVLYYILPNFEQLNVKEYIFSGYQQIHLLFVVELVVINFLYILVLLFLSILVYSKSLNKILSR
ncbi:MAG: hypothetical protein GXP45_00990 [bacterium]|nr:hypothetical protein [bacterium]